VQKNVLPEADLDNQINTLIEKRLFGKEEADLARVCLACLFLGANKSEVRKVADCKNFDVYWNNLARNRYFTKDKKIDIDCLDTDIPFLLMMKCAQGILERKEA